MSQLRVALLGLGLMGSGMAGRILSAEFPLTVYNRNKARADAIGAKGAIVSGSPREAARDADVVISMVADDDASRNVWLGEEGALVDIKPGAVCVESSTVSVPWVRRLIRAVKARNCELLDAPVTGSKGAAAAGELFFLVGGEQSTIDRVKPLFAVMGKEALHIGPSGSGAMMKLINNFMCGVQLVSLAQALGMIDRSGLDREKAISVLTNGAPGSPMLKILSPRMASRNYEPNFLLKLMAKDLRYAIEEAKSQSIDLTTAHAALSALQHAILEGLADKDMSAVAELF